MTKLRRWFADEAQLPALVWTLVGMSGLTAVARFMVMPFTTIYLSRVTHLSPGAVGTIVGLGAVGTIAFGLIGGHWADRVGRKAGILLGAAIDVVALLGMAVARQPWEFAVCSILLGVAWALQGPAFQALMTDLVPPNLRTRVFGYQYWAINVGAAVGPLLGVMLGAGRSGSMFVLVAAASLVMGLVALKWVPAGRVVRLGADGRAGGGDRGEAPGFREALGLLARDGLLRAFAVAAAFSLLCYSQIETNLARHLSLTAPHGDALFARVLSTNAITVILAQPFLGRLAERRGAFAGMVLGESLYAVASLGFLLAGTRPALWVVTMVVFSIGEVLLAPTQQAVVSAIAPEQLRGTYFAAMNLGAALAHGAGPALGGLAYGWRGEAGLFAGMAGAAVVAALICAAVTPRAQHLVRAQADVAARAGDAAG